MAADRHAVLVECCACCENFATDGPRVPLLFPCGHSVCQMCVANMGDVPRCPLDQTRQSTTPLSKNVALIEVLDLLLRVKDIAQPSVRCSVHQDGSSPPATLYCEKCEQSLCEACSADLHARLRTHNPVAIGARRVAAPVCPEHHDRQTIMCVDETCSRRGLMCRDCRDYGAAHKGHKTELVAAVAGSLKAAIAADLEAALAVRLSVEAFAQRIVATEEEISGNEDHSTGGSRATVEEHIRLVFQELHHVLEERQRVLLTEVATFTNGKLSALDAQRMHCGQLLSRIDIAISRGELVQQMNDFDVCTSAAGTQQALRGTAQLAAPTVLAASSTIPLIFASDMSRTLSEYGHVGGPLAPEAVTADLRGGVIVVSWRAPPPPLPVSVYCVERSIEGARTAGFEEVYRGPLLQASIPGSGLRGCCVHVRVRGAEGAWSEPVGVDVPDDPLDGSTILTIAEQRQVVSWTAHPRYRLLYRSSRDGATAQDFHRLCDGHEHTVSVICATDGAVFGGYTTHVWRGVAQWIQDASAFIFSRDGPALVRLDQITMGVTDSILVRPDFGPTFGAGNDIRTFPDVSRTPRSYAAPRGLSGKVSYVLAELEVFAPA